MQTSPEIDKITEALSLAQVDFKPIEKNKANSHFKNKYADLSAVIDSTREALHKNGLFVSQYPLFKEGRVELITRVAHKSGQWLESTVSLKPVLDNAQQVGSAITYARRYGRAAILDLCADDDDDGNEATKAEEDKKYVSKSNTKPNKQPPPPPVQEPSRIDIVLSHFRGLNINREYLEKVTGKPITTWGDEEFSWAQKFFKEAKDKKSNPTDTVTAQGTMTIK